MQSAAEGAILRQLMKTSSPKTVVGALSFGIMTMVAAIGCGDNDHPPSDAGPGDGGIDAQMRPAAGPEIAATWILQNVAGDTQPCPTGINTVNITSTPVSGTGATYNDLFFCAANMGTTMPLDSVAYNVTAVFQDTAGDVVYATSLPDAIDLSSNVAGDVVPAMFTVYTDGGFGGFTWKLVKASDGSTLQCSDVPAIDTISVLMTSKTSNLAVENDFACTDTQGISQALLADLYTVSVDALDVNQNELGIADDSTNLMVTAPNVLTDWSTFTSPINSL